MPTLAQGDYCWVRHPNPRNQMRATVQRCRPDGSYDLSLDDGERLFRVANSALSLYTGGGDDDKKDGSGGGGGGGGSGCRAGAGTRAIPSPPAASAAAADAQGAVGTVPDGDVADFVGGMPAAGPGQFGTTVVTSAAESVFL